MAEALIRVCLLGSRGRMGQAIAAAANATDGIAIAAQVDSGDSVEAGVAASDVVIDFSVADAIGEICKAALQHRRALVIGTTGHSSAQREQIRSTAEMLPVVFASNFSVGVNTLFWLTDRAARLLGPAFQIEIEETHHVMKKDAPSGTAKTLAGIVKAARGGADIPVRSTREGEVVGEHMVTFKGPGEQLSFVHEAESRETFAAGALAAAKWVVGKPPGLYTMQNVLGLT